ncbi:hypothetical protein PPUJ20028_46810 [Pseudomonas putida]|nr:hypothetical protein PPUJ20028_46810 [Pseudomonas putida]
MVLEREVALRLGRNLYSSELTEPNDPQSAIQWADEHPAFHRAHCSCYTTLEARTLQVIATLCNKRDTDPDRSEELGAIGTCADDDFGKPLELTFDSQRWDTVRDLQVLDFP